MNATIVSVGTELLFGQTINTNAAWLSERLQLLGVNVMYHYTVGDNPDRMRKVIAQAIAENDLVITTGGLGPTEDDISKEIVAELMGEELVLNEKILTDIEGFFAKIGAEMTQNNVKQAYVPKNSTVFYNDMGTAPAFAIAKDGKIVISLPGPPTEMKHIFERWVEGFLGERAEGALFYRILRFVGIGESTLESKLAPLIHGQTDPTIATYAKLGECAVRVTSSRATKEEAEGAVEDCIERIRELVGTFLYSTDDEELETVVAQTLLAHGFTIAAAESCTGGLLSEKLISVPGMSASFLAGYITYSNEAKIRDLDVQPKTIEKYGAVSEEVAQEMAEGARRRASSDIGIAITGIAGPDGGSEEKPVGMAWIAVDYGGYTHSKQFITRDRGRNTNRALFTISMLNMLKRILK
jgi:nicotinamide-nucleotide amidase